MECNKEEAMRAKEMAEKRMAAKDFFRAQKLALKAQRLYPGLENISQMVIVCEVHVSAAANVSGSEMDWYGILQVQQTADESSVRKQYRKLALALHPDKNKFPGAEAAFKLIGEANRVLSDKGKRYLYDIKRRHTGMSQIHPQQAHIPPTFWTVCPSCKTQFQYYKTVVNRLLHCQRCLMPFVAHDMNAHGGPPKANSGYSWNQMAVPHHRDGPILSGSQAGQIITNGKSSSGMHCEEKVNGRVDAADPFSKTRTGAKFRGRPPKRPSGDGDAVAKWAESVANCVEVNSRSQTAVTLGIVGMEGGKKRIAETSEGSNNESMEVDLEQEDNQEIKHSPIKKKMRSSENSDTSSLTSSLESETNIGPMDYPDPEFHDFDKDRVQNLFKVDQIWAVYDNSGGMPRWYARIRKIYPNETRMRITWLEANPKDQDAINWLEEDLPVACGNFKSGDSQDTEDLLMFSHLVTWEKGHFRGSYKIFPRKGDVWAVFKNWNVQWSLNPDAHRKYEFEFVEVLCDYGEGTGVEVSLLVMLEGFTSVFYRMEHMGKSPFHIKPTEVLRFSHRVPCCKLTGEERGGIPAGSLELDPASVFCEGFSPTKGVAGSSETGGIRSNSFCSKPDTAKESSVTRCMKIDVAMECMSSRDESKEQTVSLEKGTEKETTLTEKLNGVKNTKPSVKDTKSEKLDDNGCTMHGIENVKPANGVNILSATENCGKNEKIQKEITSVYRRCSPRKMNGFLEKIIHANGIKPSDKHCDSISSEFQANRKEEKLAAHKSPTKATGGNHPIELAFHNFASDKLEKLQRGQIWGLYSCQDDGLPKQYALVRKVESPGFKVHITWLEPCLGLENEICWYKKKLPIACGKFKLRTAETEIIEKPVMFSHPVKHVSRRSKFEIIPRESEIWAMYRNWVAGWELTDLKQCEYELVEVLKVSGVAIKVQVLEIVGGFRAVFRRTSMEMDIPREELLRFSHLVPSFHLTVERGGSLNGYIELDCAGLPVTFRKSSK